MFEINGVVGMITSLNEGVGPNIEKVQKFNDFYKEVAIRLPFFYPQPTKVNGLIKSGQLNLKALGPRGIPALHDLFNQTAMYKDKGGVPSLEQLAPLRTYKYVLDERMEMVVT